MNLPVLFRTIDGTSQVTIETQYADRDFNVLSVWREPPSTFLFLQKTRTTLVAWVPFGCPAVFVLFNPNGPVAQLVRAHA